MRSGESAIDAVGLLARDASSGKTVLRKPNRRGDRQANTGALYRIDEATRDHAPRRTNEGRSKKRQFVASREATPRA